MPTFVTRERNSEAYFSQILVMWSRSSRVMEQILNSCLLFVVKWLFLSGSHTHTRMHTRRSMKDKKDGAQQRSREHVSATPSHYNIEPSTCQLHDRLHEASDMSKPIFDSCCNIIFSNSEGRGCTTSFMQLSYRDNVMCYSYLPLS